MFTRSAEIAVAAGRFGHTSDSAFQHFEYLSIAICGVIFPSNEHDKARADTDIVLDAYRRYGANLSCHVLGQFCAIVIDRRRGIILLAQDSLGLRSLYYSMVGNVLRCSWTLEGIRGQDRWKLNEEYFEFYLRFGARSGRITPFGQIFRLSSGETRIIRPNVRDIGIFPWRPSDQHDRRSKGELDDELRSLLSRAVEASLRGASRPICELSGGLDSTSIAAAAKRQKSDIPVVTITSRGGHAADDDYFSALAVRELRFEAAHTVDQDDYPPFASVDAQRNLEPGGELRSALRNVYFDRLHQIGADRVLTGSGGDQIFGSIDVKPLHIADDIARLDLLGAWQAARSWQQNSVSLRSESFWLWTYGVHGAWRHARGRSLLFGRRLQQPDWLAEPGSTLASQLPQIPHRLRRASAQYGWEMLYRMADVEAKRANFHPPVTFVHPLYYRPLVEFMLSLPSDERHGKFGTRALQRRSLREWLPNEILTRQSKGTNQQLRERSFLRRREWTDMLLDDPLICRLRWVKLGPWKAAVAKARFGLVDQPVAFDAAMCVEIWLRQNLDSDTVASG